MRSLLQDIRYALRGLRRNPGFAMAAIVALALGIGVNTAIFSVADALCFKVEGLPSADHLVAVIEHTHGVSNQVWISPGAFRDWRQQNHSFAAMSAFAWWTPNLTGSGEPKSLLAARIASGFFSVVGARPLLGRAFAADENTPGKDGVVVLSYALWQRRFGGDRAVLGRAIHLDGRAYTIVGVMPRRFKFPVWAELWAPLAFTPAAAADRSGQWLRGVARLKPGVSAASAQADLETMAARWQGEYPNTDKGMDALVLPLRYFMTGDLNYQYSLFLLAATFFVLLIACANVANLQFARATGRAREAAVRAALGAGRWRLLRQRLIESVVLALLAAAAALALAAWGLDLILAHMPPEIERYIAGWTDIRLDLRSLLYAVAVALFCGVLAGIAPALLASRPDLNAELKSGGRGGSLSRAQHRSRNVLLAIEVALAMVLLAGAGLMVRGVGSLVAADQGFAPSRLLTATVNLPRTRYPDAEHRSAFYRDVLAHADASPGMTAAVATNAPYGQMDDEEPFTVEDWAGPQAHARHYLERESISGNYFSLLGVPLLSGREFDARDAAGTEPVAIISRRLARDYFPGPDSLRSALGRRVRLGQGPWLTIVGVVGDVRYQWWEGAPLPALYQPYPQAPLGYSFLLARGRAAGAADALAPALRAAVAAVDPDLPVAQILPLSKVISDSVVGLSYVEVLMTILGVIALALAAVGIFAVMAYVVGERTREIGVRVALGARRADILRLILGRGLAVTAVGLGVGLILAILLARVLAGLFYGVSAAGGVGSFAAAVAVLLSAALLACYLPARRASRVDPMVALREE